MELGNEYSGEWLDGKMHGFGTYTWFDDDLRESYVGEFLRENFMESESFYLKAVKKLRAYGIMVMDQVNN